MDVNLPAVPVEIIGRALKDEIGELLACPTTLGIAIFGSVARGDCTEGSDIELQVIASGTQAPVTSLTARHGVLIHKHTQSSIDLGGRAKIDWRIEPPFARAWVVIDRDGQLQRLKEFDQRIALAGRNILSEHQVERYRRELTVKRQDLFRFRQASGHMTLYCYETVSRSIDILYAWQRRWCPGTKKVLGDLAAWHPEYRA